MSRGTGHALLAGLSVEQQRLVDLVADAFVQEEFEWPIFNYVELTFENDGLDAWAVLQSLPQVGRWGYGIVSWVRAAPGMKPSPETEVALTLVGMSHSSALASSVDTCFILLDFMTAQRRETRPTPRAVAESVATSEAFRDHWVGIRDDSVPPPRLVFQLLEHEPVGSFGGRSFQPDTGAWTRTISRDHCEFAGLTDLSDYINRLDPWLIEPDPVAPPQWATSVKLSAAVDSLDDVWRLAYGKWLFQMRGAERIASLDAEVASRDEFQARLSVLGDLLRTATEGLRGGGGERRQRHRPLAPLSAALKERVDESEHERVLTAVDTLEAVTAIRDSRQHSGASHRLLEVSGVLGISYPILDWAAAWQTIVGQAVAAFGTIRDELRATLD